MVLGPMANKVSFIDARDREVIAWRAAVDAGIGGSDVRDPMLEAVERRLGTCRAPSAVEMLSGNGPPRIAKETQAFARQLGLGPCFTPVQSPQSNGIPPAIALGPMAYDGAPFVKRLKRDRVRVAPLPDAAAVLASVGNRIEAETGSRLATTAARIPG